MQVELSPEDAAFVREFAERHASQESFDRVVSYALLLLREVEKQQQEPLEQLTPEEQNELHEALAEGLADDAAGRTVEADSAFFAHLRLELSERDAAERWAGGLPSDLPERRFVTSSELRRSCASGGPWPRRTSS